MIPTILRPVAALAIPVMMLLGTATANAASLSPAAPLERAMAASGATSVIKVGEGDQLRHERQMRRSQRQEMRQRNNPRARHNRNNRHNRNYRNRSGIHFGFVAPQRSYRSRGLSNNCSYWSRRCTANWGYGNSNYYGCMRYEGC